MKNLANCKPSEFLKQTYRIKKAVEKWLTDIDFKSVRGTMPVLEPAPLEASVEEKIRIATENKRKVREQSMRNLSRIFDLAMGEHPTETLNVLALLCFVEPENVDDYPISDYLTAIGEMIGDDAVIGFFTSFLRLGQTGLLNT